MAVYNLNGATAQQQVHSDPGGQTVGKHMNSWWLRGQAPQQTQELLLTAPAASSQRQQAMERPQQGVQQQHVASGQQTPTSSETDAQLVQKERLYVMTAEVMRLPPNYTLTVSERETEAGQVAPLAVRDDGVLAPMSLRFERIVKQANVTLQLFDPSQNPTD